MHKTTPDGTLCNIVLIYNPATDTYLIYADPYVDEDPDEDDMEKKHSIERSFLVLVNLASCSY